MIAAITIFIGAWIGAKVATNLNAHWLRIFFGVFLIGLGCYVVLQQAGLIAASTCKSERSPANPRDASAACSITAATVGPHPVPARQNRSGIPSCHPRRAASNRFRARRGCHAARTRNEPTRVDVLAEAPERTYARRWIVESDGTLDGAERGAQCFACLPVARAHAFEVSAVVPVADEARQRALQEGRAAEIVGDLEREQSPDQHLVPADVGDAQRESSVLEKVRMRTTRAFG